MDKRHQQSTRSYAPSHFYTPAICFFWNQAQSNLNFGVNIRIACGFAGETSAEVSSIRRLVAAKNHVLLKKKLREGNKIEAILSAIALKELQSKQDLELTTEDQQRIQEITNWQEEYTVCYSCTQHFKGTVRELLRNKNSFVYLLLSGSVTTQG